MPYKHACQSKESFPDREYQGSWYLNVRSGTGTETLANGDTYTGEFAENVRSGKGIIERFASKAVIEATFKNGKPINGVITASDHTYVGELLEERVQGVYAHGKGERTSKNGTIERGEFKFANLVDGSITFPDGSYYEGTLNEAGDFDGSGRYRSADGSIMSGTFVNGVLNGKAEIIYLNGNRYKGEVVNGGPDGSGTFFFEDGGTTTGEWKSIQDGEMTTTTLQDGEVEMTYPDGETYVGGFKSDRKHGYGVQKFPNGQTYSGMWQNGLWHGQGTLAWATGESITAEFVNNRINGYGVYTKADGTIEEGWFSQNADGTFQRANN
jgi:hypothetical protein